MSGKLEGKKIAFVVTDGFEQVVLTSPKEALEAEGAECHIVSPKEGKVKGWKHVEWGDKMKVDVALDSASVESYDALVLPGGVMSPDKLRVLPAMRKLVKGFFDAGKPVAAICHGPWSLIDAGVIRGRRLTSWATLQTDLENAGATWTDEEVVVDGSLVTSRSPDDLHAFNPKVVEIFSGARADGVKAPRSARNGSAAAGHAR